MEKFQNESTTDRVIRLVVGIVLLVLANSMTGGVQIALYVLGGISLFTAATGFCALYRLLGINTKK